ncbi:uncharacterized protein LOC143236500 [Tachypleus tridentatus]|uniref:uncharacterized protein LOC143236500 n=1 Tax=Tachypleus tridentatus TaxID=6853 RepID=UPI003FD48A7D
MAMKANASYIFRKEDGEAFFPCKEVGNASTYLNSCGHCVGGNTGLLPDFGQDHCGVCHGNDECVGCDGIPNSGSILDSCGKCRSPDHEIDCFTIKLHKNYCLDVNKKYELSKIMIIGKNIRNISVFTCHLVPKFNVSSKIKTPKLEKIITSKILWRIENCLVYLKWKMEPGCTHGVYSLQCDVQINSVTLTVELAEDDSLFILNSSNQRIVNDEPTTIRLESQQYVELKLEGFPTMKYDFYCWGIHASEIVPLKTRKIAGDIIECYVLDMPVCEFNVSVTTAEHIYGSSHFTSLKPVEIVSDPPALLSAYLTKDLLEIHINFNSSILPINNNCSLVLDESTLLEYSLKDSVCSSYGRRLFITLSPQAHLSRTMNFAFAENNEIRSMCSHDKLHGCMEGNITVPLLQTIEPSFFIVGPTHICIGNLIVNIVNVVGAGLFGLEYIWNISPSFKTNATMETVTENNLEFSFASEEMVIYSPYVLSVYGVNVLGINSRTHYHEMQRIDPDSGKQKIYLSISGPRVADPTRGNTYFVHLETCNYSLFQQVQFSILWSVNSSDFQLPIFGGSQLTIPKYQMKGNAFYKITVSVLTNYPGLISTNASITVKTTTAPLLAHIPSLYEVYFNQTFCLDGSLSTDLGRQQGKMKFLWICTKHYSNGCYVRDKNGIGHIRLEQWLQKTTMPSICIQGGLLNPGIYSFTLIISKDIRNNNQTCVVNLKEKQDGIEVIIQRVAEPSGTTLLNAIARSDEAKDLRWKLIEKDFDRVKALPHDIFIRFYGYVSIALYYSILPHKRFGQTMCFALYISDNLSDKHQCVEVLYKSPPRNGVLKVLPKSGLGLITQFTLDATQGWFTEVENHPLSYRFVYGRYKGAEEITIATVKGHVPRVNNVRMPCGQNTKEIFLVSVYVCDWNKICNDSSTSVTIECSHNDTKNEITEVANELQVEINKRNFHRSLALASVIMKTFEWKQHLSSLYLSKRQTYLLCSKAVVNTLEYYSRSLFRVPYLINEVFDVLNDVLNIFPSEAMSDGIKAALHRLIVVMIELLKDTRCHRMSPFEEFWQADAGTDFFTRLGDAKCFSLSEREIKILLEVYEILKREMDLYKRNNLLANKRDSSEALFNLMLTRVHNSYNSGYISTLRQTTSSGNTSIYATLVYTSVLNKELFNIMIGVIETGTYYVITEGEVQQSSWLCGNKKTCRLYSFNLFICIHSPSTFLEESDIKKASLGLPLSPVVHFMMWTSDNELKSVLNNRSITLFLPLLKNTEEMDNLQCVTWNTNLWDRTTCLKVKLRYGKLECRCQAPKYIGIFRKPEKNESSSVKLNSDALKDFLTAEAVKVALGFNATIEKENPEMESDIRYQLASILQVQESRIMNLVLLSDLKIVTFVVKLEHSSMVLSRLENLVRNKELRLVDQDGNLVEVVPHLFFVRKTFLPPSSESKMKVGTGIYILVALQLAITVLVCSIIILSKKMKRKKRVGDRSIPS